MSIWLTRPLADSVALAEALAARGKKTHVAPVMQIELLHPTLPAAVPDAVLLTSRHAAHALPVAWHGLPVFCVGNATAAAVGGLVITGEGDVLQLLPNIANALTTGATLAYLSGEDVQVDVGALLGARGIHVERIIAYRAAAMPALDGALIEKLKAGEITRVAFYSARTARITAQLLQQAGLADAVGGIDAYCLSLAVAEAAGALPWHNIRASHVPTNEALLSLLAVD